MRETLGGSGSTRDFKNERVAREQRNRSRYYLSVYRIATTFYITDFPLEVKTGDLWVTFAKYGRVGEVFIPKKLTKWGKRFGFVNFKEVTDAEELEERLRNVTCGEFKLRVNRARFGREEQGKSEKSKVRQSVIRNATVVKGKSYKDASTSAVAKAAATESVKPAMEVLQKEEVLEELSKGFVGILHYPRDAV